MSRTARKVPTAPPVPPDGVSLGIDWISAVHSDPDAAIKLRMLIVAKHGEPDATGAASWYGVSERWACGIVLQSDGTNGGVRVEYPGSYLSSLSLEERIDILKMLDDAGWRCTRVDLCADVVGYHRSLWESALASCEAGHLVHARRFTPHQERSAGKWWGRTLYLGARGKLGSGRFGRIYDKGLETKAAPIGRWERFEVEFSSDNARTLGSILACCKDKTLELIHRYLFGAFDFMVRSTQRRHLESRERALWWEQFVRHAKTACIKACRRLSSVYTYARWITKSVAPSLKALAEASGRRVEEVLESVVSEWRASLSPRTRANALEYAAFCT